MVAAHKSKTNLGVGLGFLLQVLGFILCQNEVLSGIPGCLLVLAGIPLLTWGCMHYAEGKGHSKWVGLVALAGCIGLVVLWILPDLHKSETPAPEL